MKNTASISKTYQSVIAPSLASLPRTSAILNRRSCRLIPSNTKAKALTSKHHSIRYFSTASPFTMSQKPFSNTEVPGDKPADPYTATNKSEPELKEKVQDLVTFMDSCKFGMMTTRIGSSGLLTSRCMALAAKVGITLWRSLVQSPPSDDQTYTSHFPRRAEASTFFSTPTPSPAKLTT